MAVNTSNKHLTRISSLFEWARRNGYTDSNYARGLTVGRDKRPRDERHSFDEHELIRLFESHEHKRVKKPYQYWVPLIALYSGARIEEICQLHVDDIRQVDGVWVFDINAKAGKKTKTAAGARLVPIHPKLTELGLLNWVSMLRNRGITRLFTELRKGRDGYSQVVSKWFSRYRIRCGITNAGKVFHSLRHTFIDSLKQSGIPRERIAAIVGHADDSMTTGRYGGAFRSPALLRDLQGIVYNLNHTRYTLVKTHQRDDLANDQTV